jgi:hypothetical protein
MGIMRKYKSIGSNIEIEYLFIASELARKYPFFSSLSCTKYLVKTVIILSYPNRDKLKEVLC